jgi:quercetin dioxygenase-like cupin family protein
MMSNDKHPVSLAQRESCPAVESPPGIFRTTLAWNEQSMVCHFRMSKGAKIPLHDHPAVQNGYMMSGKVRFLNAEGEAFVAVAGTGYCFGSMERHGAEVMEDSEAIECFSPARPEYAPPR